MYEAMNGWLDMETWHTPEEPDRERFFRGLDKIIDNRDFNPDKMGEYCRQRRNIAAEDHESHLAKVIDDRVQDAWAVKEYLAIRRPRAREDEG
jgi:hypothetical protein